MVAAGVVGDTFGASVAVLVLDTGAVAFGADASASSTSIETLAGCGGVFRAEILAAAVLAAPGPDIFGGGGSIAASGAAASFAAAAGAAELLPILPDPEKARLRCS